MSKLIILRGNSGSGKTTVAKELQNLYGHNTMRISQDVVRREMLMVKDGADTKALPLLQELLKYGHAHSEITVLEGIMYAAWYQPLFVLAGQLYGPQVYAYYFDLPFEETLRRHQTKANCTEFGEAEMRRWWEEKDYSPVLAEETITAEESLPEILARIVRDLG